MLAEGIRMVFVSGVEVLITGKADKIRWLLFMEIGYNGNNFQSDSYCRGSGNSLRALLPVFLFFLHIAVDISLCRDATGCGGFALENPFEGDADESAQQWTYDINPGGVQITA